MKAITIASFTLVILILGSTHHLLAQAATSSNGFDEFLNFDDNAVPPGWQIVIFGGSSAEITGQRFQIDQVDTYAALTKDKTVPAGTTQVSISFRTAINDVDDGAGSQSHLITQDGNDYYVSLGKAGYGDEEIRIYVAQGGTTYFDQYYPPAYGQYLLSIAFRNGQISFTVLEQGKTTPLANDTVAVSTLDISQLKTIQLYGWVTTGVSQWIDDANIIATTGPSVDVAYGIDVSHSQSSTKVPIEWSSVWGSNHIFAFVKSTEGIDYTDNQFHPNIDNALAAGVIAAPYHVGRPDEDIGTVGAQAEAAYFLSVNNSYLVSGHLRPALDIETAVAQKSVDLPDWIDAWMTAVRTQIKLNTGEDAAPILYMSGSVIKTMPASMTQYPLWVANPNGSLTKVGNISPWMTWAFHQYLVGMCPGVTSPKGCDLDVFNGASNDLNSLLLGDLSQGLLAYYPFNGNANDESGNGHNGVPTDAELVSDRFGNSDSAFLFNGTTSYIQVPDSPDLDLSEDFTIAAWVQRDSTAAVDEFDIVSKHIAGPNDDGSWVLRLDVGPPLGRVLFQATPDFTGSAPHSNSAVRPGVWTHVAITYEHDSGNWVIYLNGKKNAAGTEQFSIQHTGIDLLIGAEFHYGHVPPYFWFFHGALDEIRIYSRALSASEIQAILDL